MCGMAISPAQVEYLVAVRDYRPKAFTRGLLFADTGSFHWLQLEILRVGRSEWPPLVQKAEERAAWSCATTGPGKATQCTMPSAWNFETVGLSEGHGKSNFNRGSACPGGSKPFPPYPRETLAAQGGRGAVPFGARSPQPPRASSSRVCIFALASATYSIFRSRLSLPQYSFPWSPFRSRYC